MVFFILPTSCLASWNFIIIFEQLEILLYLPSCLDTEYSVIALQTEFDKYVYLGICHIETTWIYNLIRKIRIFMDKSTSVSSLPPSLPSFFSPH